MLILCVVLFCFATAALPYGPFRKTALLYANQKELGTVIDELKKSRVGQTFQKIDFVQLVKDMHSTDETAANIKQGMDKVSEFFAGPVFKELFSSDFAVALLPMDATLMQDPGEAVANHLLFAARPQHSAQLLNLLATALGQTVDQTASAYGNYTIKRFQEGENGRYLFAVVVKDTVLIGLNEQVIHDSIDCYDKKKKSLTANPNYQKLMGMYHEPRDFSYVSLEGIKNQAAVVLSKGQEEGANKEITKQLMTQWNGLQAMGCGSWSEADAIRSKVVVLVDNAKVDTSLKDFYAIAPEKNPSLAFAPEHTLAYYWTNTASLPLYWKLFQSKTDFSKEMIDNIHQSAKAQLGMDLEEFLGLFNKQMTVIIQNTNDKRPYPVPDFSILVRLNDSKRFHELVDNLMKKNAIAVQVNDYKGVGITSLEDFPESAGVAPVYAITNDYFMVATCPAYMKQIVDAMKEGHGLAETAGFKSVSTGMNEENNSLAYVRVDELVHLLKVFANTYIESSSVSMREDGGEGLKLILDRVVNPLLDSLTMYSDIGGRSKIMPGQIIAETTTAIKK